MGKVSYEAPFKDKKGKLMYRTMTGDVAWIKIGDKRVKCVMQSEGENVDLVHYATGQRLVNNNSIRARQVQYAVQRGNYHKLSDREAAEMILNDIISNKGAEHVLNVINAAPILNT
jgi:hypothetical protein